MYAKHALAAVIAAALAAPAAASRTAPWSLSDMAPNTARADGQPGPNACKLIQDVIFLQHEKQAAN